MEWTEVFFRTLFIYFFVLIVMRLMGKREIGKLSVFDLVVSIMIADLAVISIENGDRPLVHGILPIATLMVTQIGLSYLSLKNRTIRHLVDGKPAVLIKNGRIQVREMARNRYNLDDLMAQLREKGIDNVADVEFAILETSGKLSVFPKEGKKPVSKEDLFPLQSAKPSPMPVFLIVEGRVVEEGLKQIGRDRLWLEQEVRRRGHRGVEEIFLATIDSRGRLHLDGRDDGGKGASGSD
ncbi:MAG: hypothetical protein CW342_11340 [Thermoactinomycetaceae bacterium]|jgi:uncharacterized membrane protein YcaP (DUF421 family)|nr:hypothetical protein [Bacillota bacterium]MBO2533459.1 hypothetical protein [Thermoactinomycetaceae bacterium]